MKKNYIVPLSTMIAVIVLESLPYGVVLNFEPGPGTYYLETYSYFSLTPYGYGVFCPFLTAVMSVLIVLFILLTLLFKKNFGRTAFILCIIAAITSFLPVIEKFTITGICIFTLLFAATVLLGLINKRIVLRG